MEIDVISYPHVLQSLQEETLFQLSLSEESNKVLLLEKESEKGDNERTLFCFLHRTTSDFDELQTLLQVNTFDSVIYYLVEIFDLGVSVDRPLVLDLIAIFVVNIVQDHIMAISEMENSHQVINEKLLHKNQVSHREVVALINSIILSD